MEALLWITDVEQTGTDSMSKTIKSDDVWVPTPHLFSESMNPAPVITVPPGPALQPYVPHQDPGSRNGASLKFLLTLKLLCPVSSPMLSTITTCTC